MSEWLFIFVLSFSSAAPAAETCPQLVESMRQMELKFGRLRYAIAKERKAGLDQQPEALEKLEDIDQMPAGNACRLSAWKAFVALAAAQAPFDLESEAAQVIAARLGDKELLAIYRDTLANHADRCRSQLLSSVVEEKLCQKSKAKKDERDPEAKSACRAQGSFDYEACIGYRAPNGTKTPAKK